MNINTDSIIQQYPSLASLQAAQDWKAMSMKQRMDVVRFYQDRAKLASAPISQDQFDRVAKADDVVIVEEPDTQPILPTAPLPRTTFSLDIILNELQQAAVDRVYEKKSFCFTGKAGTGKTTGLREIAKALLNAGYSPQDIAMGAFTRVATGNIRKAIEKDAELYSKIGKCIQTLHKHLEFKPIYWQDEEGVWHMRFSETRTEQRPFDFRFLLIEESSMVDLLLYEKIYAAMRRGTVVIFVGDINQLPPVFGKSIFNYALHQLPVIELTEVYRQALDSGIIQNALRVLEGQVPVTNKDCIVKWFKETTQIGQGKAAMALGRPDGIFHRLYKAGDYNPKTDVILSPWNKQEMGTIQMNDRIAQFLGDERQAIVHEIIAGRRKLYLAIGDQVFIDKQLGVITKIAHNDGYIGKVPRPCSVDLLRVGQYRIATSNKAGEDFELTGYENLNVDEVADDEKKNQASHIVHYRLMDDLDEGQDPLTADEVPEHELASAGDFGEAGFSLGYCLTVHKAQGCEWRKVFIILHKEHTTKGNFVSRELLYTAITRARESLVIFARDDVLQRGVSNQIIKGKTLEEKIAFINSGAQNIGDYPVIKEGEDDAPPPEEWPDDYQPRKAPTVNIPEPVKPKPKVAFKDMSAYVPEAIKYAVRDSIKSWWNVALKIYGDEIGATPSVSFDCQKGNVVALANPRTHGIKFNPVYLTKGSIEAKNYIIDKIAAHEVAHLVTARYVKQTGHGKDWVMSMKLLGQEPNQFYSGPSLPDWKEACKEILNQPDVEVTEGDLEEGEEE